MDSAVSCRMRWWLMRWANIATILVAAVLVVGIVAYNHYDVTRCGRLVPNCTSVSNAFAHPPFAPTWTIDQGLRDKVFSVRDIIKNPESPA